MILPGEGEGNNNNKFSFSLVDFESQDQFNAQRLQKEVSAKRDLERERLKETGAKGHEKKMRLSGAIFSNQ